MKITARAPSNIAFIKYWGKANAKLRLPANSSISMNLSDLFTTTSVEFRKDMRSDRVFINAQKSTGKEKQRVTEHLDRVRKLAKTAFFAEVKSTNNFPKGTGIASSASGFAALTVAATRAAGLGLSEKELSVLARLGSGSAARSIPDGFVEWRKSDVSKESFAHSIYPENHWEISDVVAILGEKPKKVSSSSGHELAKTSPFFKARLSGMQEKLENIKQAMRKKDFTLFGEIVETEAVNMHAVMMTSKPALFYWTPKTLELISAVVEWRKKGIEAYFTLDAGPNVHIICLSKDTDRLKRKISRLALAKSILVSKPGVGARVIE